MIEDALKALSAADAPPTRDPAFEIAILTRIEHRRFRRGMVLNVALGVATIILLALVMPGLERTWPQGLRLNDVAVAALSCGLTLALQWGLMKRG